VTAVMLHVRVGVMIFRSQIYIIVTKADGDRVPISALIAVTEK